MLANDKFKFTTKHDITLELLLTISVGQKGKTRLLTYVYIKFRYILLYVIAWKEIILGYCVFTMERLLDKNVLNFL